MLRHSFLSSRKMAYLNKLEVDLKEIWPLIEEAISTGGEFRLFHRGKSMLPLLREGKDSVLLVKPDEIKKNDIVLFVRESGQFVMHRIVKIKGDEYIMCGDYQCVLEHGIKKENIVAKVKGIYRDNDYYELEGNKEYKKYVNKLPFRRFKIKLLFALGINK